MSRHRRARVGFLLPTGLTGAPGGLEVWSVLLVVTMIVGIAYVGGGVRIG